MSSGLWLSLMILLFLLGGLTSSYALMKLLNRRQPPREQPPDRDE